mgnify:FL=1
MPIFKVGQLVREAHDARRTLGFPELGTGIITRLWTHKFGGQPGADVRFFLTSGDPMPIFLRDLEHLEAK